MNMAIGRLSPVAALLLLCHCGGVEKNRVFNVNEGLTPPAGLEAQAPTGTTDNPYPQVHNSTSGTDGDVGWTNVIGYVHAPIDTVWEATKNKDTLVDNRSRRVDVWRSELCPTDDKFVFCMIVHNTTHAFVTVDFDVTWKHSVYHADNGDLKTVNIAYQFTRVEPASLGAISVLEGRYILEAVTPNVTRVWMYSRLLVAQEDPREEVVGFAELIYGRLQALGNPPPRNEP